MQIIAGDCVREMAALVSKGIAVDAVVTDPPYHLVMAHERAGAGLRPDQPISRMLKGFMGKAWDGGDIAFRPETWAAIGAVLKPGGYLLAFGGSRTHHRIWSAIEDAGFVIQDTIMWLYGSGFPKGRTQLKPAHEPICVAYKPGGKRVLNIDECRIETDWNSDPTRRGWQGGKTDKTFLPGQGAHRPVIGDKPFDGSRGRWPANVCHDGSDEVMEAFAAFQDKVHAAGNARTGRFGGVTGGSLFPASGPREMGRYGDDGSPARFYYCAKASKVDRAGSKHPTVKPVALMRWLVRLVTPPKGTVLDPFAGSGTIAAAAIAEGRNAILIEREAEYIADIRRRVDAIGRAAA